MAQPPHGGMNFVASAVEKTGVDKHHTLPRGTHAFLEVNSGAALLIHNSGS